MDPLPQNLICSRSKRLYDSSKPYFEFPKDKLCDNLCYHTCSLYERSNMICMHQKTKTITTSILTYNQYRQPKKMIQTHGLG